MEDAKDLSTARQTAHKEILTTLADRVRAAMSDAGLTHRALGARAGVSAGTVSSVLAGKDCQLTTLVELGAALGFDSIEEMFGPVVMELPTHSILETLRSNGSTS